jgi:hypothetical protein
VKKKEKKGQRKKGAGKFFLSPEKQEKVYAISLSYPSKAIPSFLILPGTFSISYFI